MTCVYYAIERDEQNVLSYDVAVIQWITSCHK